MWAQSKGPINDLISWLNLQEFHRASCGIIIYDPSVNLTPR